MLYIICRVILDIKKRSKNKNKNKNNIKKIYFILFLFLFLFFDLSMYNIKINIIHMKVDCYVYKGLNT